MNPLKKFMPLNSVNKALNIILLGILVFCTAVGIYIWYFTNNVYYYFGKTTWSHQKDKEAGKYIVEKYFLGLKLPYGYSDLKYSINGYCGLDCLVYISVKVDRSYFDFLTKDKTKYDINYKSEDRASVSPNFWDSISNEIVLKPKNMNEICITESYYPGYYWYQDGHMYYYRLDM